MLQTSFPNSEVPLEHYSTTPQNPERLVRGRYANQKGRFAKHPYIGNATTDVESYDSVVAGLEGRFLRLHQRSPPTSTGASHQPKTMAEMRAVAMACRTLREAVQACAATSPGFQAGFGGGGPVTGWMSRVIWEEAGCWSRYFILPCTSSI